MVLSYICSAVYTSPRVQYSRAHRHRECSAVYIGIESAARAACQCAQCVQCVQCVYAAAEWIVETRRQWRSHVYVCATLVACATRETPPMERSHRKEGSCEMCWCSCAYDSTHTQWLYSVRPTAAARTVRSQHSSTSSVHYLQGVCIECRGCASRAVVRVAVAMIGWSVP